MKRYETAFNRLDKLRTAMVRPERDAIGREWPVDVDETYVGSAKQGEGHGRHDKTFVGDIVEVRPRKKAPDHDPNLPSGQRPRHQCGSAPTNDPHCPQQLRCMALSPTLC